MPPKSIRRPKWLASGLVGSYWDSKVVVSGKIERVETRGEEAYLKVAAQGTQSETLLR